MYSSKSSSGNLAHLQALGHVPIDDKFGGGEAILLRNDGSFDRIVSTSLKCTTIRADKTSLNIDSKMVPMAGRSGRLYFCLQRAEDLVVLKGKNADDHFRTVSNIDRFDVDDFNAWGSQQVRVR